MQKYLKNIKNNGLCLADSWKYYSVDVIYLG
jgi:hypothetical protein